MRGVLSCRAARAPIGRAWVCAVTRVAAVRVPIAAAACQCDEDWHPGKRCHSNPLPASQPASHPSRRTRRRRPPGPATPPPRRGAGEIGGTAGPADGTAGRGRPHRRSPRGWSGAAAAGRRGREGRREGGGSEEVSGNAAAAATAVVWLRRGRADGGARGPGARREGRGGGGRGGARRGAEEEGEEGRGRRRRRRGP